jgi:hypothetical protein
VSSQELGLVQQDVDGVDGVVPELSFVESLAEHPHPGEVKAAKKAPQHPADFDSDIWTKQMAVAKDRAEKTLAPEKFAALHSECSSTRKNAARSCGTAFCEQKGKCGQHCPRGTAEAPMPPAQVIPLQPGTEDNNGNGPFHYIKEVEDKEEIVKERIAKEKAFKEKQAKEAKTKEADYKERVSKEQDAKQEAVAEAVDKERVAKEKSATELDAKTKKVEEKEASKKAEQAKHCEEKALSKKEECEIARSKELNKKALEKESKEHAAKAKGSADREMSAKAAIANNVAEEAAGEAAQAEEESHEVVGGYGSGGHAHGSAAPPPPPVPEEYGQTNARCMKYSAATCITTLGCHLDIDTNECIEGEDPLFEQTEKATGSAEALAIEEGKDLYREFDRCCSGDYEPITDLGVCQDGLQTLKSEAVCAEEQENPSRCDGTLSIEGWDKPKYPNGCWFFAVPSEPPVYNAAYFTKDGGYKGCSSPDASAEATLSAQAKDKYAGVICRLKTSQPDVEEDVEQVRLEKLGYPNGDGICQPSETKEAQWTGYYEQGEKKGDMDFTLTFHPDQSITGAGSDKVGAFVWSGNWAGKTVNAIKKYTGKHTVYYDGTLADEEGKTVFSGTWKITGCCSDKFKMTETTHTIMLGCNDKITEAVTEAPEPYTLKVRTTTGTIDYAESDMEPQIVVTGSSGVYTGIFQTGNKKGAVFTTTLSPDTDIGTIEKVRVNSENANGWFFTKFEVKSGTKEWTSVGCTNQWLDAEIDATPYYVDAGDSIAGMYGKAIDMHPITKECTAPTPAVWGKQTDGACFCKMSGKDGTCALNGDPDPWCRTMDNCAGHKSGKGNWDRCTPETEEDAALIAVEKEFHTPSFMQTPEEAFVARRLLSRKESGYSVGFPEIELAATATGSAHEVHPTGEFEFPKEEKAVWGSAAKLAKAVQAHEEALTAKEMEKHEEADEKAEEEFMKGAEEKADAPVPSPAPVPPPECCFKHGGNIMPFYTKAGCAAVGSDAKWANSPRIKTKDPDQVYGECLKVKGGSYTWDNRGVCPAEDPESCFEAQEEAHEDEGEGEGSGSGEEAPDMQWPTEEDEGKPTEAQCSKEAEDTHHKCDKKADEDMKKLEKKWLKEAEEENKKLHGEANREAKKASKLSSAAKKAEVALKKVEKHSQHGVEQKIKKAGEEAVEKQRLDALGFGKGSDICEPKESANAKWTGYYEQKGSKANMDFTLKFGRNHKITGSGSDKVGAFDWSGSWYGKAVQAVKKYRGKHTVYYNGVLAKEGQQTVFSGNWKIVGCCSDKFKMTETTHTIIIGCVDAVATEVSLFQTSAKASFEQDMMSVGLKKVDVDLGVAPDGWQDTKCPGMAQIYHTCREDLNAAYKTCAGIFEKAAPAPAPAAAPAAGSGAVPLVQMLQIPKYITSEEDLDAYLKQQGSKVIADNQGVPEDQLSAKDQAELHEAEHKPPEGTTLLQIPKYITTEEDLDAYLKQQGTQVVHHAKGVSESELSEEDKADLHEAMKVKDDSKPWDNALKIDAVVSEDESVAGLFF